MKNRGIKKDQQRSWIKVKNVVHEFLVGDKVHPQIWEIHETLWGLEREMKGVGYFPNTNFVIHDTEEENKEYDLAFHSEKTFIA